MSIDNRPRPQNKKINEVISKADNIEKKQNILSWIGLPAVVMGLFLNFYSVIRPPVAVIDPIEKERIEQMYKEQKENGAKLVEMGDGIVKINEVLRTFKPTPMPTPTIVIPLKK